ncbi:MAG: hypothetical protein IPM88_05915 [Nitrospira sp.]|nr:hypothetical protein [Nitrospira sp.]
MTKLKRLEGQRGAAKQPVFGRRTGIDAKIRQWLQEIAETDPYQAGLEAVARQLRANLGDVVFGSGL